MLLASIVVPAAASAATPVASFSVRPLFRGGNSPVALTRIRGNVGGQIVEDIAVADSAAGRVRVYRQRPDHSYAGPSIIALSPGISAMTEFSEAPGYYPSLAVTNVRTNTVTVIPGTGPRSFGTPVSYPAGPTPSAVVSADLNGDGRDDLVVANRSTSTLSLLDATPTGRFSARTVVASGGTRPVSLAVVTHSLDTAIAVANYDSDTVSLLRVADGGGLSAPQVIATGDGPVAVASADLYDDGGYGDVVVAYRNASTVQVIDGNSDDTYSAQAPRAAPAHPIAVSADAGADYDGDRNSSFVVANASSVAVYSGVGFGATVRRDDVSAGPGIGAILTGEALDIDGDGRGDILAADQHGVVLLRNTSAPRSR